MKTMMLIDIVKNYIKAAVLMFNFRVEVQKSDRDLEDLL